MRLAAFLCLGLVGGCGAFAASHVPNHVIAECMRSSGVPQGTRFRVEESFKTDGMDRRVLPSAEISPATAFRANQCIASRVMGGDVRKPQSAIGPRSGAQAPVPAPAAPVTQANSRPQTEPYISMWGKECISGYGTYQGGLSCPGY